MSILTSEFSRPYIAWQEFDNHAQDQTSPEDVKTQQCAQQAVEEVEAEEGRVEGQGVHPRRMYDPGWGTKAEQRLQSQPPTLPVKSLLTEARLGDSVTAHKVVNSFLQMCFFQMMWDILVHPEVSQLNPFC